MKTILVLFGLFWIVAGMIYYNWEWSVAGGLLTTAAALK